VFAVDLWSILHGIDAFLPRMLEQGEGHIVNTASMAGLISGAGNALYGVTKHAVVALSEALWNELAAQSRGRVHVSVLCPGWINTQIMESSLRNRPEAVRHHTPAVRTSPEAEIRRKQVESLLAGGLDPRRVGELVLDAVRSERFWILTHPAWKSMIRHRLENILEERDPTPAGAPRP
jgi:short-subunit dehydrogenase